MGEPVEILSKMGLCLFYSFVIIFLGSVTNGKITGQVTTGYNNTCLWKSAGLNRSGPKNFDCERFVIDSTDQLWNMYRDPATIKSYLHKYMVDDWESITFMGEYIKGMENLTALVLNTLNAFPDIKLHIVDTFCEGNDIDGYKTTMPVIHTATHLGHHPIWSSHWKGAHLVRGPQLLCQEHRRKLEVYIRDQHPGHSFPLQSAGNRPSHAHMASPHRGLPPAL